MDYKREVWRVAQELRAALKARTVEEMRRALLGICLRLEATVANDTRKADTTVQPTQDHLEPSGTPGDTWGK